MDAIYPTDFSESRGPPSTSLSDEIVVPVEFNMNIDALVQKYSSDNEDGRSSTTSSKKQAHRRQMRRASDTKILPRTKAPSVRAIGGRQRSLEMKLKSMGSSSASDGMVISGRTGLPVDKPSALTSSLSDHMRSNGVKSALTSSIGIAIGGSDELPIVKKTQQLGKKHVSFRLDDSSISSEKPLFKALSRRDRFIQEMDLLSMGKGKRLRRRRSESDMGQARSLKVASEDEEPKPISQTVKALIDNRTMDESLMTWRTSLLRERHLERELLDGIQLWNEPEESFQNPLQQPAPNWDDGRRNGSSTTFFSDDDDDMTVMTSATASSVTSLLSMSSVLSSWRSKQRKGASTKKHRTGRRFLDLTLPEGDDEEDWADDDDDDDDDSYVSSRLANGGDDDVSIVSSYSIPRKVKKKSMESRSRLARNFLDLTIAEESRSGESTPKRSAGSSSHGMSENATDYLLKELENFDDSPKGPDGFMNFPKSREEETAVSSSERIESSSVQSLKEEDMKEAATEGTDRDTKDERNGSGQKDTLLSGSASITSIDSDYQDWSSSEGWEKADEFFIMDVHEVARQLEQKLIAQGHPSPFWSVHEIFPKFADMHVKIKAKESTCCEEEEKWKIEKTKKESKSKQRRGGSGQTRRTSGFLAFVGGKSRAEKDAEAARKKEAWVKNRDSSIDAFEDDLGGLDDLHRFLWRDDNAFFRNFTYQKKKDSTCSLPTVLAKGLEKSLEEATTDFAADIIEDITSPLHPHREQQEHHYTFAGGSRRPSLLQSVSSRFFGNQQAQRNQQLQQRASPFVVQLNDIDSADDDETTRVQSKRKHDGSDAFRGTEAEAVEAAAMEATTGNELKGSTRDERPVASIERRGSDDDISQITFHTLKGPPIGNSGNPYGESMVSIDTEGVN